MKKSYYLLLVLIFFPTSCSENETSPSSVQIRLSLPEGYTALDFDKIKVTLTNKELGTVYTARCSSNGEVIFTVESGYYTASVHYQTNAGLIFSGRIESLPLLSGQAVTPDIIELPLVQAQTSALIIKEIYFGGCEGVHNKGYQADQYVTLYNNSDQTIYLDGLCVGVVDPANNTLSPWMKHTDMKRIPINDLTWQFPGTGHEYPLLPRTETTIATNAVDHTGSEFQQPNSVDLSHVDWGFWDVSLERQNITAGVKPMKLLANLNPLLVRYAFPVIGPTVIVFSLQDSPEEYVQNPENRKSRPGSSSSDNQYLMVPTKWILDCIECVKNAHSSKRVPSILDSGTCFIPDESYSGKSVIRKKAGTSQGGIVYQDTNNSTEDMEVVPATLKTN